MLSLMTANSAGNLSEILEPNSKLGHVVRNVGLYRLRGDDVTIATSQIALQVLGHTSAEERVRIIRKDLQFGVVVSNGCVVTLQFQVDEAASCKGARILWA